MSTERRITDFEQAYFLGIGGIGMSAIARYLLQIGMPVMGYDKTSTPLTEALRAEGAEITFEDAVAALPQRVTQNLKNTLFILTPAIPKNHPQWVWLQEQQATILKRSEVLGSIARNGFCIAVAQTPRVSQWAEITKIASGRLRALPRADQAAVYRFGSSAYMGLP